MSLKEIDSFVDQDRGASVDDPDAWEAVGDSDSNKEATEQATAASAPSIEEEEKVQPAPEDAPSSDPLPSAPLSSGSAAEDAPPSKVVKQPSSIFNSSSKQYSGGSMFMDSIGDIDIPLASFAVVDQLEEVAEQPPSVVSADSSTAVEKDSIPETVPVAEHAEDDQQPGAGQLEEPEKEEVIPSAFSSAAQIPDDQVVQQPKPAGFNPYFQIPAAMPGSGEVMASAPPLKADEPEANPPRVRVVSDPPARAAPPIPAGPPVGDAPAIPAPRPPEAVVPVDLVVDPEPVSALAYAPPVAAAPGPPEMAAGFGDAIVNAGSPPGVNVEHLGPGGAGGGLELAGRFASEGQFGAHNQPGFQMRDQSLAQANPDALVAYGNQNNVNDGGKSGMVAAPASARVVPMISRELKEAIQELSGDQPGQLPPMIIVQNPPKNEQGWAPPPRWIRNRVNLLNRVNFLNLRVTEDVNCAYRPSKKADLYCFQCMVPLSKSSAEYATIHLAYPPRITNVFWCWADEKDAPLACKRCKQDSEAAVKMQAYLLLGGVFVALIAIIVVFLT